MAIMFNAQSCTLPATPASPVLQIPLVAVRLFQRLQLGAGAPRLASEEAFPLFPGIIIVAEHCVDQAGRNAGQHRRAAAGLSSADRTAVGQRQP